MGSKSTEAESKVASLHRSNQLIQDQEDQNKDGDAILGVPFEGPSSSRHASVVYISQEASGIAHNGGYQNEAANQEVTFAGNSGLSLAVFQQQMMLNQQMLVQQQQTMTSLISRVDSLAKSVGNSRSSDENVSAICSPPTPNVLGSRKRKIHELSSCEDVSSASDIASDSSSDSENECETNRPVSSLKQSRIVSETLPLVSHSNTTTDESVLTTCNSNMKLLKEMGQEFDKVEALGPKLNETLSKVVNSGIRAKIDRNVAKDLCDKYFRPENCEALVVPKINKELWNTPTIKKTTKEVDKSFQTAQRYLNQGLVPLVTLMDKLLQTDKEEEFKLAKDAFQLLAYAHRDVSNIRRQQLKAVVTDKYKQLCNDSTPLTENLLGDDLEKQIKTMDEVRKVGKDLSKYKGDKTYNRSRGNGQGIGHKKHEKYKNFKRSYNYGYHYQQEKDSSFLGKRSRQYQPAHKKHHKKTEENKQ